MNTIRKRILLENEIRWCLRIAVKKWRDQHYMMSHIFFDGIRHSENELARLA